MNIRKICAKINISLLQVVGCHWCEVIRKTYMEINIDLGFKLLQSSIWSWFQSIRKTCGKINIHIDFKLEII